MASALYGTDGFYRQPGAGPAAHFRTSAHASPRFAEALLGLLEKLDDALGRPDPLDLVDVGGGRGELLSAICAAAPRSVAARLRPTVVEVCVHSSSPGLQQVRTVSAIPDSVTGLLVATEWLDNVPVDIAELDNAGVIRYVMVDATTGEEALGEPVTGPDAEWLATWWPLTVPGSRAEIGRTRDQAWAKAVAAIARGAALAVDYGHTAADRPPLGTLTGFRDGREVPPVPDGSRDITAHVAIDALGALGGVVVRQRAALRALGVDGSRPPLALAHRDPVAYLRRLATASATAELTDPAGLGGHYWLLQPVGLAEDVARWLA
jgi:SAM-dependent MidA family methyltransferase